MRRRDIKAVYYYGPGDLRLEDIEKPKITKGEILVKVNVCAVCGTDLRINKFGHFKIPQGAKRVLGHEISGVIAEVGEGIEGYSAGDRVAIPPNVGCGNCKMCVSGFNQMCPDYEAFGISWDGGFQEFVRIPASAVVRGNVVKIPDNLSYVEAAICEPFSCTFNSWRMLKTSPGDTVLIIGAGPIGACHVMINRFAGAAKIIVADVSDVRLEEIARLGADMTINSAKDGLIEPIRKATNGRGCDVIITACSVPEVQAQALELAAVHGRINFFGGMPSGKENVTLNTNLIHYKELVVLGTTGSSLSDFHKAIEIAASGKLKLGSLATGKFTIERTKEAFEYAASGSGMKAVVAMEGE
jgi:threonine dehydrogenase-like Zn-dependent dehydrogenase